MFLSGSRIFLSNRKNQKVSPVIFIFSVLLLLFTIFLIKSFYGQILPVADAYTPFPPPPYVPCTETRPQEFHSLRPYQASPCNQDAEDLALFCGNDFILLDTVEILKIYSSNDSPPFGSFPISWEYRYDGQLISPVSGQSPNSSIGCGVCNSAGQCISTNLINCIPEFGCSSNAECAVTGCTVNNDGTETCNFVVDNSIDIAINLEGSDLPIMGYTEPSQGNNRQLKVVNSLSQDETLTDVEKVNEYVSWYLNGVIGRAEYGPPEQDFFGNLTEEGKSRVTNYSGPLKKLLAFESQIERRIEEIEKARTSLDCDPTADPSDPDCIRHNQVVGCYNLLGQPTHCYPSRTGVNDARIAGWIFTPPLLRNYPSHLLYLLAYKTWQLIYPNTWKLFSYIPFSSTEDRIGEVEISQYSIQPSFYSNVIILSSAITKQSPAELFFSHMQESYELADLLQSIFSPKSADLNADPLNVVAVQAPLCNVTEYRRNPGDLLFATEITATIDYMAQVSCSFTHPGDGRLCEAAGGTCLTGAQEGWTCDTYYNQVDCNFGDFCGVNCESLPALPSDQVCDQLYADYSCYPTIWSYAELCPSPALYGESYCPTGYFCGHDACVIQPAPPAVVISDFDFTETCSVQIPVSFQTVTKTPLAKEVWSKLVSGPAGAFRRIFPHITDEEGRPIRRLWDLPAATGVIYSSLSGNTSVVGGASAQLYFPHIGGVHEYFLNCIQKTLRPQGYGQGCVTGPPPLSNITGEGSCSVPPPVSGSVVGAGSCQVPSSGFCSEQTMRQYGFSGCRAKQAAIICNAESGGNPSAINCGCLTGSSVDYSVGLFQINLLAHSAGGLRCYEAFEYSCPYYWCENQGPISCTVLDQSVVDQCASYFFDPAKNAKYASQLSLGGTNWTPWAAYTVSCRTEVDAQCP